jgi:hypothetical protein
MHAGNKKQQSETKKKQVQSVQGLLIMKNKTREIPEFLVRTNTPSVCVNASSRGARKPARNKRAEGMAEKNI